MHVTLLEDLKALGTQGQVVDVPQGYAEHFLFPQHLAVAASKKDVAEDEAPAEKMTAAQRNERRRDEQLAGDIDGLEVIIPVKVVDGKVKEPVEKADIKKAVKELGYKLDVDWIALEDKIKDLGTRPVMVEFPSGLESEIQVTIEAA